MRIMIKGGVWKNIEDEILKAAVMKYGLNQWSRISSLLVRKSAKQCKARWYEWLDPSIKKTEWSKAEEEKLLHLAKIFPNQWRTISPAIGRTPAQCIEHYEKLLEEAAGKIYDPESDPRKLRPGEVDPCPEIRPPRPDPVDMDEDEKEMLQEARARLSNTRGKKAKRKMREKQLEEGRRLATVQRKRELRASGIEMELKKRIKPKVREMDYNVEIPFEHMVPEGRFKIDEDLIPTKDELMISAQHIEGSMRAEQEAKKKIEDERKMRRMKEMNMPAAIEKVNNLNEFKVPMKRMRLDLPKPRVTENETDELVKEARTETGQVTDILIENKAKIEGISEPQSTDNAVMIEAYNAYWRSNTGTPLVGGDNKPIIQERPESVRTVKKTEDEVIKEEKTKVSSYLNLLPEPENAYELEEESSESDSELEEIVEEEIEVPINSSVVQRDLPRPYVFNPKKYLNNEKNDLKNEVVSLVLFDMHHFPMKGAKKLEFCVDKELIDNESMAKAIKMVQDEIRPFDIDLDSAHKDLVFCLGSKEVKKNDELTLNDYMRNAKVHISHSSVLIEKSKQKNANLSEKILETSKVYQEKIKKLEKNIKSKQNKFFKLSSELEIYSKVLENEKKFLADRISLYQEQVSGLSNSEDFYKSELSGLISQISAWEWCSKTES